VIIGSFTVRIIIVSTVSKVQFNGGVDAGHGTQVKDLDGDEKDGYDEGRVPRYLSPSAKPMCPTCQLSYPPTGPLNINIKMRDSLSMMCARFQTQLLDSLINIHTGVPKVPSRSFACKLYLDSKPL
jgi:hypothetical protein